MNVGKLKKLLENVPDNTVVLIPGIDHDYYEASGEFTTALKNNRTWNEDWGDNNTPEIEYGKRLPAFVIRA